MRLVLECIGLSPDLVRPGHILAVALASTSILSLLFYFWGFMELPEAACGVFLPGALLLMVLVFWASSGRDRELARRVTVGVWAGSFATLVYDLVRVPLVHAGIPVFQAISYLGTMLLAAPRPGPASEIAGWAYHFSNGVGFAMMYTVAVRRPSWRSAVLWGVILEAIMLLTPYAEVFGYRRSFGFVAASLSAHVFYGLGLWGAARRLPGGAGAPAGASPAAVSSAVTPTGAWRLAARLFAWCLGPIGIALIALDFHRSSEHLIWTSPLPVTAERTYVTWNVPEPDRIGAIWLVRRFLDPSARLRLVEPMSPIGAGIPLDVPEAEIRRYGDRSAFEVAAERSGRSGDPALAPLAQLCYLTEVRPWALASSPETSRLADDLARRLGACARLDTCLDAGLRWFDETYAALQRGAAP